VTVVQSTLRFGSWENAGKIVDGDVDLTARIDLDEFVQHGDLIELVDPEYDVFAIAVVRFVAHTTIEHFVQYQWPRHVQYESVDEMVQVFREYYNTDQVARDANLYVIGFDVLFSRQPLTDGGGDNAGI